MFKRILLTLLINIICWGVFVFSVVLYYGKLIFHHIENALNNKIDWDLEFILFKMFAIGGYALLTILLVFVLGLIIIPRK